MAEISEESLKKLLSEVMQKKAESLGDTDQLDSFDVLKRKVSSFLQDPQEFKRGDIVRWKKGLKNKRYPKENQLCYVIEELSDPIVQDTKDTGSPYYREPLDLVVALLDDDSDLVVYHFDKRRFEKVVHAL